MKRGVGGRIAPAEMRALVHALQAGRAQGRTDEDIVGMLYLMFERWHTSATVARVGGGKMVSTRLPSWCRDLENGTVKCKRCGWRGDKPAHYTGFKCKKCQAPWWDTQIEAAGGRVIDGIRYMPEELNEYGTPLVVKPEAE